MIGWQNQHWEFCKAKNDQYCGKVVNFEQNHYLKFQNDDGIMFEFNRNCCICLEDLLTATEVKFLRLSQFSAISIMAKLVKHLSNMIDKGMSHGNINASNIWIIISNQSERFSIIEKQVQIEEVHFIHYRTLLDIQQSFNIEKDLLSIENVLRRIIKLFEPSHEIHKAIEQQINENLRKKVFLKFIEYLDSLPKKYQCYKLRVERRLPLSNRSVYEKQIIDYFHTLAQTQGFEVIQEENQEQVIELSRQFNKYIDFIILDYKIKHLWPTIGYNLETNWVSGWNYKLEVILYEIKVVETKIKEIFDKLRDPVWADLIINQLIKLFDDKVSIDFKFKLPKAFLNNNNYKSMVTQTMLQYLITSQLFNNIINFIDYDIQITRNEVANQILNKYKKDILVEFRSKIQELVYQLE